MTFVTKVVQSLNLLLLRDRGNRGAVACGAAEDLTRELCTLARAQVYILDAIAKIPVQEAKDAESIVERVVPRLQHANSAVVLSAVKARPRLASP